MNSLDSQAQRTDLGQNETMKTVYLACVVLSVVVSWGIFAQFFLSGGASIAAFFEQCVANPIATLLSSDILLSAAFLLVFINAELKRLGMPRGRIFLYAIATFFVGVCCGLSLFLYQREDWRLQQVQ